MDIAFLIIQLVLTFLTPWVLNKYVKGSKVAKFLSPVVLAYIFGILLRMFEVIPIDTKINELVIKGSILVATPLLLFNTDVLGWIKHARSTILSFIFCILSALFSAVIFGFVFNNSIDNVWEKSGMLVGIFTGGTANLNAVGIGVGASEDSIVMLNTAEILWGGLYLIILTSIAPRLYGIFLEKYRYYEEELKQISLERILWSDILKGIGLSLAVVASSVGLTYWIYGNLDNSSFLIVILSAISVGLSFYSPVRKLNGSYETGDYLLLVFCIAIGMTFDLGELMESGGAVFFFTGAVMLCTILLHLLLSRLFSIDRDTTIITSTAAIYGPAFIGQVANVIKNKQIIFAGISTSLVGYAVGNFLGISISEMLQLWLN